MVIGDGMERSAAYHVPAQSHSTESQASFGVPVAHDATRSSIAKIELRVIWHEELIPFAGWRGETLSTSPPVTDKLLPNMTCTNTYVMFWIMRIVPLAIRM